MDHSFIASMKHRFMADNRAEYGPRYDELRFATTEEAKRGMAERAALIADIGGDLHVEAGGSKLHVGPLSPGCRACVAGEWSCLFVNGVCNADCFYCPTAQDDDGPATTNGIAFTDPGAYVAYLERFGFAGASMSGGEPLLTPERTLAFIRAVKTCFGDAVHVWCYTNGLLLSDDMTDALKHAGLDELRVDIGATGYRCDAAARAVGRIPTVTVEIPAIPEEESLMREKIIELKSLGVDHLNLHQLRLTPHNFDRISRRGYTFLHGEKVTVMESELAAVRLLQAGRDAGLAVNYCSFIYKHRYQNRAARVRGVASMIRERETMTEAGYIRADDGSYAATRILGAVSYRNPFVKVPLGASGVEVVVERMRMPVEGDYDLMPVGLADYY